MFAKSASSTQEVLTGKPLRNCKAQEVTSFQAEVVKDSQRIAYGGASYILDRSVVLLDTVQYRCCLYDPSHIKRAEVKLSSKPHSVTHMGQSRIAVSLPEENMIQVLEVGSEHRFRFERNVYTDWPCYALVSAGDDKIVVCYMIKRYPEVVMVNLDGDKKCTFYTGLRDGTDANKIHIAYDKWRKRTCVVDRNFNEMHVMLKDGSERSKYPDEHFRRFHCSGGIDYDQEGNLYFTSQEDRIYQLSPNMDQLHNFPCYHTSPTTLCFHPYGRDFIVATQSGEVHCFEMQ